VRFAPRSLQARVTVLAIGCAALMWAAAAVLTWRGASHELDELLDAHLAQAAALLVVQQVGELEEHAGVDAPLLHRYAPRVAFQVFHHGRLVLRSANAPTAPMVAHAPQPQGFSTVQLQGRPWRVFATRGADRDVQVYVGELASSRDHILRAVLQGAMWPLLVGLPLLAALTAWAVHRGVAPLRRLRSALAQRSPDALQPLAVPAAPAEIAPVAEALNALFARISDLLEAERRFTADAAHELRTPIAAIRTHAQVALGEHDDALRAQALRHTLEGCDRAASLVDQLLMLSRLDALPSRSEEPVDLVATARHAVASLAPAAMAKDQILSLDAPEAAIVGGSELLLGVLVRNLVDNAVRYSPRAGEILVSVLTTSSGIELRVEDSGPGLGESDRLRLGERFFRVQGTGESGSGLGWSIVRRIAQVHGACIRVGRSAPLGGLAVHVSFTARTRETA
jgi:two-component system sensor histidine kinase QseC